MTPTLFQDKYPILVAEIDKNETSYRNVAEIADYLKRMIAADPYAQFIATFDHLAHTTRIRGEINPAIREAVLVVFCFGIVLPNPQVLAVRPRSIGIADMGDRFTVSFMEPPMKHATDAMTAWVQDLRNTMGETEAARIAGPANAAA